jgi:hypothetical protein
VCRPEDGWARLGGTSAEVFLHPDYEGKVLYYKYERVFPHQGVGHRIAF